MSASYDTIIQSVKSRHRKTTIQIGAVLILVAGFSFYTGLFNPVRLAEGIPSIFSLMAEGFPPDFRAWSTWMLPLLDTLAMSVAGTALALALEAARNIVQALKGRAPEGALNRIDEYRAS